MMLCVFPRSAVRHYRFSLLFFFLFMFEVVLWSTPDVCGDRYPNLDSYFIRHNDLFHLVDKDQNTFRHAAPSSVFFPALSSPSMTPDKILANEFKNTKSFQMKLMELGDDKGSVDNDAVLDGILMSSFTSCATGCDTLSLSDSDSSVSDFFFLRIYINKRSPNGIDSESMNSATGAAPIAPAAISFFSAVCITNYCGC